MELFRRVIYLVPLLYKIKGSIPPPLLKRVSDEKFGGGFGGDDGGGDGGGGMGGMKKLGGSGEGESAGNLVWANFLFQKSMKKEMEWFENIPMGIFIESHFRNKQKSVWYNSLVQYREDGRKGGNEKERVTFISALTMVRVLLVVKGGIC